MAHPPVAVNDLDEIDGDAGGNENGWTDMTTKAKADAVIKENAEEGLHQVIGKGHLAHGREITQFGLAFFAMPVEADH